MISCEKATYLILTIHNMLVAHESVGDVRNVGMSGARRFEPHFFTELRQMLNFSIFFKIFVHLWQNRLFHGFYNL